MAISFPDFTQAMDQWLRTSAPPQAKDHLRASTWKRIMRTGRDVEGGTVFDASQIVDRVFNGRDDLAMSVAVPVTLMLNERFGPPHSDQEPQEPPPAGRGDDEQPEPEAAPGPAPQPGEGHQEQGPAPSRPQEEDWIFPTYDYSRPDLDNPEDGAAVPVTVDVIDGSLRYAWPDAKEQEVYRVVVSDTEEPYGPEDFEQVAVTRDLSALDTTPWTTAVRFVTVWGYVSPPGGGRFLGQCRRVASTVVVHPLADWELVFDAESGAVNGSWTPPVAPPGATVQVRTARLPLDQPVGRFLRGSAWRGHEIPNNGAGFQDTGLTGGKQHNYVAAVEVEVAGQTWTSMPVRRHITPEVARECIADLAITEEETGAQSLTVTWTQFPQSTVSIYRTNRPVAPEAAARGTVPAASLSDAGLLPEARVSAAAGIGPAPEPGRQLRTLSRVPWPAGHEWDTIHLTPVTEHDDGQVTIGQPLRRKRAGGIENATLTRRLSWDLVTFTWPGDATTVELRLTGPDGDVEASGQPLLTISKEEYRSAGGCVIQEGLPARGGRLHLNSITYMAGAQIASAPTAVEVPCLWRYAYTLRWPGDLKVGGGFFRQAAARLGQTLVEITVEARQGAPTQAQAIGMALVHNPDHLPLSVDDGQRVGLFLERPTKEASQEPVTSVLVPPEGQPRTLWFDHRSLPAGYFRLLIDSLPASAVDQDHEQLSLEHYAMIDPDLGLLHKAR